MAAELLEEFDLNVSRLTLVPAQGGRFEVSLNGKLLFSKLSLRRHPEAGEILALLKRELEQK